MMSGQDNLSNNDRMTTLPDPENLHSSQTNKQITHSSSQVGQNTRNNVKTFNK